MQAVAPTYAPQLDSLPSLWNQWSMQPDQHQISASGEAVSAAMRARSAQGYVIGTARIGYLPTRTATSFGVEHVLDPDVAPHLHEAFLMAAAGRSVRQIAAWLVKREVKGKRSGPVSTATVQRMLTDPFYAGFIRDHAGCLSAGRHKAITDGRTFATVQRRLMARRCSPLKTNETLSPDEQIEVSHMAEQTEH